MELPFMRLCTLLDFGMNIIDEIEIVTLQLNGKTLIQVRYTLSLIITKLIIATLNMETTLNFLYCLIFNDTQSVFWYNSQLLTDYYYAFDIPPNALDAGEGYNYNSIMHYGAYAFSINGQKTMYPKQSGVLLMDPHIKKHMVESDVTQIKKIYKC